MFTGLIQAVGTIIRIEPRGGDVRLHIATGALDVSDIAAGDSIAVSGVCLTALEPSAHGFVADVSNETLGLTTLGDAQAGSHAAQRLHLQHGDVGGLEVAHPVGVGQIGRAHV